MPDQEPSRGYAIEGARSQGRGAAAADGKTIARGTPDAVHDVEKRARAGVA
ncbi:hypothetical protein [Streptomyces sp. NPDC126933]|uniref:hypothetical protein n=1 Tax=unclassified Streptomyces TaxID=2593676 RepID=UPI00365BAAA7